MSFAFDNYDGDPNDIDAVWDTLQDGNFWIHKDADTARLSAAVLGLNWVVRGDWSAIQITDAYVLWGRCFNLPEISSTWDVEWNDHDINPVTTISRLWDTLRGKMVASDWEPTTPFPFGERLYNIVMERFTDEEKKLCEIKPRDFMCVPSTLHLMEGAWTSRSQKVKDLRVTTR